MTAGFSHEGLHVYRRSLAFCGKAVELAELFNMQVELRKTWSPDTVREDHADYLADGVERKAPQLFHHETLDVYRVSLDLISWFSAVNESGLLVKPSFRRLDALGTSIVLNVAEGNGRFSPKDQSRFSKIAHQAAIKMAAHLDICKETGRLEPENVDEGKDLLLRIAKMTLAMSGAHE